MNLAISRPTTRSRSEVSLSFFSLLFAELVANCVETNDEHLEVRLHRMGADLGARIFPLLHLRERPFRRESKPIACLQFIALTAWRSLFGKVAEVMTTDQPGEYYLVDRGMILNKYISVSESEANANSMVNCAYFAAGIIEGMMQIASFKDTRVDAVFTHAGSLLVVDDPMNVTFVVRIDGAARKSISLS